MSYPSPCDRCVSRICDENGSSFRSCAAWLTRYRYRQKQINAFAKKLQKPTAAVPNSKVFTYSHPDDVRRYLITHPCIGCPAGSICDAPCPLYLHWYNDRIKLARKKAGL